MYSQQVTISFRDGSTKDTTVTQWAMSQWALYALSRGWKVDVESPGLIAIVMLRYQAWAELHRDVNGARPSFEVWDGTVDSVDAAEAVEAPPTQPAPAG